MELERLIEQQNDVLKVMDETKVEGPPDENRFQDLCSKLKILSSIEIDHENIDLKREELEVRRLEAEAKRDSEVFRAQIDDKKSKRDAAVKIGCTAAGLVGGFGAMLLTIAAESDRLIRSKAYSFASKIVSKLF